MYLELDEAMAEELGAILRRRHRQVPGTHEQKTITSILRRMEEARAAEELGISSGTSPTVLAWARNRGIIPGTEKP